MAIKAIRATIKLGYFDLDAFQLPDGKYRYSQTQAAQAIGDAPNNVSRFINGKEVQTLIPERLDVSLLPVKEVNSRVTAKTWSQEMVAFYWQLKAIRGCAKAQALVFACLSETLERRADVAFGILRTEEERNQRLDLRLKGKLSRRELTDSIKEYIQNNSELSENYAKFIYANCSDHLNKIILGVSSKQAKEFYELPKNSLLRNAIPSQALRELELTENYAGRLIDELNVEPLEAVKQACSTMFTRKIGLIEKPD